MISTAHYQMTALTESRRLGRWKSSETKDRKRPEADFNGLIGIRLIVLIPVCSDRQKESSRVHRTPKRLLGRSPPTLPRHRLDSEKNAEPWVEC